MIVYLRINSGTTKRDFCKMWQFFGGRTIFGVIPTYSYVYTTQNTVKICVADVVRRGRLRWIYQELPGSIRRLHCHGWPSTGEKSLKLINTPSHSPNDGQASPCLDSHSTHIPILIACSILCLVLPHHFPIHAPQSTDF